MATHLLFFFFKGASASEAPAVEETPAVTGGSMPRKRRRRYLLPDNTLVEATPEEIVELLQPYIERETEQEKPKKRVRTKKRKPDVFVPIEFESVPDMSVATYRPVLPPLFNWRKGMAEVAAYLARLQEEDEEEDMILLLG